MVNNKKIIAALVPMRHHSQRVPGKNSRQLDGKPLYHYILSTLLACPQIDLIAVDTDSSEISKGLQASFPQVLILERPQNLRRDDIPMNDILAYDTSQVKADFYLQTHSTNPLLQPSTISRAIETFLDKYPLYDSLFGVTRIRTRLWDQLGRPINHNPSILLQTQDLPPIFEENSCIYMFTRENLLARHNRLGERPYLFEIEASEACDIDEEIDFYMTESLMQYRANLKKK
jgi:CMP-N-acetylneuraminic acid synthetase